jgi:hypothetical protein
MARSPKASPTPAAPTDDLRSLEAKVDALTAAVERVGDELRVIREVMDECREHFEWAVNNDRLRCPSPALHITSLPKDPVAPDFGERINRFSAEDLPDHGEDPGEDTAEPPRQPDLF